MYLDPAGMPVSLNRPAESVVVESDVPEMNIEAPSRYPPRMLSTAAPVRIAPLRAVGAACDQAVAAHDARRLSVMRHLWIILSSRCRRASLRINRLAQRSFHFVHITTDLHGIPLKVAAQNSGGTNPVP